MTRNNKGRSRKTFTAMTAEELAKATAEFEAEFVADEFVEPDAAAQYRWRRARRKRGRPRQGQGAKVISVSVERGLLQEADRLAKEKGVSRASLIRRGLRAVLAAERNTS